MIPATAASGSSGPVHPGALHGATRLEPSPESSTASGTGGATVILSLTTLPSRVALLRPTLESLLAQTHPPSEICVCVPRFSVRERTAYELPSFLSPPFDPRISVLAVEQDFGPGTKLVGAASRVRDGDVIIAVDDDHAYRDFFVETLVRAQRGDPGAAHSFFTYPFHGLVVGQGADGIAVRGRHLRGMEVFYAEVCAAGNARLADDYWISFFLARQGVPIRSVAGELRARRLEKVYQQVHSVNALVDAVGAESRTDVMLEAERACFSRGCPTLAMRVRRALAVAFDLAMGAVKKVGRPVKRRLEALAAQAGTRHHRRRAPGARRLRP